LGRFSPQEAPIVSEVLDLAVKAVETSLKEGIAKAMSLYNNRSVAPLPPSVTQKESLITDN
jgi:PTH1 family peptidyl-tRNA hydrolase